MYELSRSAPTPVPTTATDPAAVATPAGGGASVWREEGRTAFDVGPKYHRASSLFDPVCDTAVRGDRVSAHARARICACACACSYAYQCPCLHHESKARRITAGTIPSLFPLTHIPTHPHSSLTKQTPNGGA